MIGVAGKEGKPLVEGVEPGDLLLHVGKTKVKGTTMGRVVDALRGKPGDRVTLVPDLKGQEIKVKTRVVRYL